MNMAAPPSPQNPHVPGEPDRELDTEGDRVIAMRYLFLCGAGMPPEEARLLALSDEADWHKAVDMLQHGCDPTLIVRILT
jgi:hypothetical protein